MNKVLVSGCFDSLHPGHIWFLECASRYGKLYVSVGSDEAIVAMKHRQPIFNQDERLYMVKSLKFVQDAWVGTGTSILDFAEIMGRLNPNLFIVNEDGDSVEKRNFVENRQCEYIVLDRLPRPGINPHSTTQLLTRGYCGSEE